MNQRKNERIPFDIKSELEYNNRLIPGDVLNISLSGLYIHVEEPIPSSSIVEIKLFLTGEKKEMTIDLSGRVVRKESSGVAIKLIDLDLNSIIELRDLLMDNHDNSDKILAEFHEFVKSRKPN